MNPVADIAKAIAGPVVKIFTDRHERADEADAKPIPDKAPIGHIDWEAAYKNSPDIVKNPEDK